MPPGRFIKVVNLFNIGESFYGQMRRYEGNLSVNLPPLEVDGDENPDGNATQMTQAVSQYLNQSATQTNNTRQSTVASCVTLILTDGVSEIKAIEFGSRPSTGLRSSALSFNELSQKLRPGVKIRLRGPLLLRNNVLLVPPGAIQSLSSRQLEVLGGEVDELLEKYEENTMYELGKLLANKLNIPLNEGNNSLPSWFPRITPQVRDPVDNSSSTQDLDINHPHQSNQMSNLQRTHQDPNNTTTNNTNVQNRDPLSSNRFTSTVMPSSPELWDDETFDDAILSHAAQSLEKQLNTNRSGIPSSRCQSIPSFNDPLRLPNFMAEQLLQQQQQSSQSEMSSIEDSLCTTKRVDDDDLEEDTDHDDDDPFLGDQVDPDILATALAEIDDHKPVKDLTVQQPIVNVVKSYHSTMKVSPTLPTVATSSSSSSSTSSSLMAKSFTPNQPPKLQSEPRQTLKQTLLNLYTRNDTLTKRDMDASSSPSPSAASSSSCLPKIQLTKPSTVESIKSAIVKPTIDIDDSEDLLPPAPKRKPIELKQNTASVTGVSGNKSNLKDILRSNVPSSGLSTMLKTDEGKSKTSLSRNNDFDDNNNNDNNNNSSTAVGCKPQTAICQPIITTTTTTTTTSSQSDYRFQPFCYIQDMYHSLLQNNVNNGNVNTVSSVYRIRGLLISLLSSLEHHHGTKWTLAVRITDGSAIVDLDVSSELLTEWIGLTPQESESLRQMSRVDPNSSNSFAVQEAQKHRQRLRTALTNFQGFLSHLGGLFTITAQQSSTPDDTDKATTSDTTGDKNSTSARQSNDDNSSSSNRTTDKASRPLLIGYSELDNCWLKELHNRVITCYSDKKFIQKLKNVFN
ncbi:unnamed protein product [Trichobilharzia szidati]|nr:unnamed protein product [Trichobilharzia szidati]CAH8823478.1 unnamed protein product [Trichobilharzia szidati]